MEQKMSPSKSALQYGALFGVLMVLEFVVTYVVDIDPVSNPTVGIVMQLLNNLIFPVTFIFIGCSNYKKNLNEGFISFRECLKIGVSICLIAGLVFSIFNALFNVIFPEYIDEVIKKMKQIMLKQNPNTTSDQLEIVLSWTKKSMSPLFAIPITLLMFSLIGLIYSSIIGAFVKNDNPQSL